MKAKMCLIMMGFGMGICAASLIMLLVYYDFLVDRESYIIAQAEMLGYQKREQLTENEVEESSYRRPQLEDSVIVTISEGMTVDQIADLLAEQGLVVHKENFLYVVRDLEVEGDFIAGQYQLPVGISVLDIISALTTNK